MGLGLATQVAPGDEQASTATSTDASFAARATQFADALERFRNGEDDARDELQMAARLLARDHDRGSAPRVVATYTAIDRDDRIAGAEYEVRVDTLRNSLHELDDERAPSGAWRATEEQLRAVYAEARELADPAPAARAASLLARLAVRRAERDEGNAAETARAFAEDARARFALIGFELPRLEPLWVIARTSLVAGELGAAEDAYSEMEEIAHRGSRPAWRERALVGLVGIARERGDAVAVDDLLDELATFRSPAQCWALAREFAIQRLGQDDIEAARRWLEQHPPSPVDDEIDLIIAREEWEALVAAVALRTGEDGGSDAIGRVARTRVEALVEEGRTLVEEGRASAALEPLEHALALARDRKRSLSNDEGAFGSASPVGEWLGLTAVETLARAHVALGAPLEAAAVIEAAHANIEPREARERVLDRARIEDRGLVTWVVGADSSLAVHVARDGSASSWPIPHGRAAMGRAIERARAELLQTRSANSRVESECRKQIARVVLPPSLRGTRTPVIEGESVALLPHGVLERLPFAALPVGDGQTLGLTFALSVETELRDPDALAPAVDFQRVDWVALGAPETGAFKDLPSARRELKSLESLQPRVSIAIGSRCSGSALRTALQGSSPLHIATHVAHAPGDRLATTGLVVSGDQIVTAREIARMRPQLPLIVLAACGSADGDAIDGLSVRGVAQATLSSGTRAAVVTLWPIADGPAGRASLAFHGALLAGARPAEALRRARVLLWRLGLPSAEWAAYRLLGRS